VGQTADQLRQEIAHKREDAAAKIGQIEARMQEIPNLARATVKGTVNQSLDQAKTSLVGSVDRSLSRARVTFGQKVGQMKEQGMIKRQVDQRPMAAVGAALAGGYLLGKVLGGGQSSQGGSSYQTDASQAHSSGGQSSQGSDRSGIAFYEQQQQAQSSGKPSGKPNAVVSALQQAAREAGLDNTLSALSAALLADPDRPAQPDDPGNLPRLRPAPRTAGWPGRPPPVHRRRFDGRLRRGRIVARKFVHGRLVHGRRRFIRFRLPLGLRLRFWFGIEFDGLRHGQRIDDGWVRLQSGKLREWERLRRHLDLRPERDQRKRRVAHVRLRCRLRRLLRRLDGRFRPPDLLLR
jgi:hypothetical protein